MLVSNERKVVWAGMQLASERKHFSVNPALLFTNNQQQNTKSLMKKENQQQNTQSLMKKPTTKQKKSDEKTKLTVHQSAALFSAGSIGWP